MFINGFLALTDGAGVELVNPFYSRQPITFRTTTNGVTYSANSYAFDAKVADWLGRAIYDAPVGGNLLLSALVPAITRRPVSDRGEVGALRLVFTAQTQFPDGEAFSGTIAAATVCGTWNDTFDIVSLNAVVNPATGAYVPQITTAPLTAGVALTITRGVLRASSVPA